MSATVAFALLSGAVFLFSARRPAKTVQKVTIYVREGLPNVEKAVRNVKGVSSWRTLSPSEVRAGVSAGLSRDLAISDELFPHAVTVTVTGSDTVEAVKELKRFRVMGGVSAVSVGSPVHVPATPAWYQWFALLMILGASFIVYHLTGEAARVDDASSDVLEHLGAGPVMRHRNVIGAGAVLALGMGLVLLGSLALLGVITVPVVVFIAMASFILWTLSVLAHLGEER